MRDSKGRFVKGQSTGYEKYLKTGHGWNKGKPNTWSKPPPILYGEENSSWKGNAVGYSAIHDWIERQLGKANHCSFDPTHTSHHFEWANISGSYLRDVDDYAQLCVKCHRQYDSIRRGHFAL